MPWQIWELTLADRKVRQVYFGLGRCDSAAISAGVAPGVCAADAARISIAVGAVDGVEGA